MAVILLTSVFITGCPEEETVNFGTKSPLAGKLLILQVYGNGHITLDNPPSGISHSFIELYNNSNEPINLSGITLHYADGIRGIGNTEDEQWDIINLTGAIPAKSSFLILGAKHSDINSARFVINDNDGDINVNNLVLSRRAFKAALIEGDVDLNVQNPFDINGKGRVFDGYIDMVGAVNTPDDAVNPDNIFGFETAPARCSASEAVRRKNLVDTDNNSIDFISVRYGPTSGDRISLTDEEVLVRRPRNSGDGSWDPFQEPGDENEYEGLPPTQAGEQSDYAGELLILQIGASQIGSSNANVSHSFVELFNNSSEDIDLTGISLQYAEGNNSETKDKKWQKIDLTGTINAGHSFLILGGRLSTMTVPALDIEDDSGDMNIPGFVLNNRAVKVALIQSTNLLTIQNPFNMDGLGAKAAGYIDMIGVINNGAQDMILGLEGTTAVNGDDYRISQQITVRRITLEDTDNNVNDFQAIRYNQPINSVLKEIYYPKNTGYGEWDPCPEPEIIEPSWPTGSAKLMILQANGYGNANNTTDGSGFPKSLIELYNNTGAEINFDTNDYYLHIGDASNWTYAIKLTGKVPAYCSYLVVTTNVTDVNATPRSSLPQADHDFDFIIGNNGFKIALLRNQSTLSVANPFTEASLSADYIDMLGAGTNAQNTNGFETARFANQSRPRVPRRLSLTDTDNNSVDFGDVDYRNSNPISDADLLKVWPRNAAAGAWNPITGEDVTLP